MKIDQLFERPLVKVFLISNRGDLMFERLQLKLEAKTTKDLAVKTMESLKNS